MSAEERTKLSYADSLRRRGSRGNVAAVDEFMAADYVEHPRPSTLPPGTEGLKQLIAAYRTFSST